MSFVLRPLPVAQPQLLPLVAAVSTVRGIESATGLKTLVRWPNDILTENRKVAGVIAESGYAGNAVSFAIVGIGVNCNSRASQFTLQGNSATSLSEELGHKVAIAGVRRAILSSFGGLYASWTQGIDVVENARSLMRTIGRHVMVKLKSGEELSARAENIEATGGLVISRGGRMSVIHAEDIESLRETIS